VAAGILLHHQKKEILMFLIRIKRADTGEEIEIGEGGRLNELSLRNLFVELHLRLGEEPGGEPMRLRTAEGTVVEIDPADIESVRFLRDGEDITDRVAIRGKD
jgi:hypothetical protein